MPISVDRVNTELSSFVRRLDFQQLPVAQLNAQFSQLSSQMSQLGTQVGQTAGGFQSLTQELDVPPELLEETLQNLETAAATFTDGSAYSLGEELGNIRGVVNRGIAMLADNPPGLQIQNAASSLNSDLEAITEGTVGGGFNNLVITANTPEAMAQQMSAVAGVSLIEAQQAVQAILPQVTSIQNQVSSTLNNLQNNLPVINELSTEVQSFLGQANDVLGLTSNARGLLNNVVESLTGSINSNIRALLDINTTVPNAILSQAVTLVQAGSVEEAAQLLQGFTDLSIEELTEGLRNIDVNLGSEVTSLTAASNLPVPSISPTQRPERPDQPITDSSIVYGLISSVDRDITELVFRTVRLDINQSDLVQPGDYPAYHFIVQPDGTINRSAALNDQLDLVGHTQYSLGIVVGARNNRVSAEQTAAIDNIMRAFFSLIPYGQIINYAEVAVDNRPEIIFDFVDYATEHFNYRTIMSNNISSLSTQEIQQRISAAANAVTPHIDDTV